MGNSKNLLRDPISGLRCSPYLRTAALLGPTLGRSLRFLKLPTILRPHNASRLNAMVIFCSSDGTTPKVPEKLRLMWAKSAKPA